MHVHNIVDKEINLRLKEVSPHHPHFSFFPLTISIFSHPHFSIRIFPSASAIRRYKVRVLQTPWFESGLCNRNVPFHWAREVSEISDRNFCWIKAPKILPDLVINVIALPGFVAFSTNAKAAGKLLWFSAVVEGDSEK